MFQELLDKIRNREGGKRLSREELKSNLSVLNAQQWTIKPHWYYIQPEALMRATGGKSAKRINGILSGTVKREDGYEEKVSFPWDNENSKLWFDLKKRKWSNKVSPDGAMQNFLNITDYKIRELTGKGW